ncbi:MAG: HEPN domain-containing protein [Planctomycetes bacterium]|nr:HEPN domain-containing protein [Planctomycetota bacterium]
MPETWLDVARDARKAASALVVQDRYRSAVARAYFAAFSKVTHELVVTVGLPMPAHREGPSHARIRPIIQTSMPHMAQNKRDKLSELIGRLYTLRIDADYKPSSEVGIAEARAAISMMTTVFESF